MILSIKIISEFCGKSNSSSLLILSLPDLIDMIDDIRNIAALLSSSLQRLSYLSTTSTDILWIDIVY